MAINIAGFKLRSLAALLLSFAFALFGTASQVSAHGGEETAPPKPVSNQAGTVTQTARAGDFEILLKYSTLEPDTAAAAKLFVTRFATNEPFSDAKPTIEITSKDGKTFEAAEIKSDAPGSFSFKLPPLPQGTYTVLARLNAAGKTDTATFAGISVEHPASDAAESSASGSWLRTIGMILAAIVVLGLFGGLIIFALRLAKRETAGEEAVSV